MAKMPFNAKDGIVTPKLGVGVTPNDHDQITTSVALAAPAGSAFRAEASASTAHGPDSALVKLVARNGVDAEQNLINGYGNAGQGVGNTVRTFKLTADGAIETRGTMTVSPAGRSMLAVKDGEIHMLAASANGGVKIKTDVATGNYNSQLVFETGAQQNQKHLVSYKTTHSQAQIDVAVQNNLHVGDGIAIGNTKKDETAALHIAHGGDLVFNQSDNSTTAFSVQNSGTSYFRDSMSIGATHNSAYRLNVQERQTISSSGGADLATIRSYSDINATSFINQNANNRYSAFQAYISNSESTSMDTSKTFLFRGFTKLNSGATVTNPINIYADGTIKTTGSFQVNNNEVYHAGNKPSPATIGAVAVSNPHFNTSTHARPIIISRNGSTGEALSISVGDTDVRQWYENDETSSQISWRLNNTGTEGNNQASANMHELVFKGSLGKTELTLGGHKVYHEGFRPAPGDLNAYAKNEDITITRNRPWITLDSNSSGSNTNEQAAGISVGESGRDAASIHMTYTGDGTGRIGMGAITANNQPTYTALQFKYTDSNVYFPKVGKWITDFYHTSNKPTPNDIGAYTKAETDAKYYHKNVDVHIAKAANVNSTFKLTEDSGNHGIEYRYNADVNHGQIIGRESNVDRVVANWHRNAGFFNVTGQLQEKGKRVYSPNNKPTSNDIPGLAAEITKLNNNIASVTTTANTSIATKLDKTAKAVDSALLNGHSDYYSPRNKPSAGTLGVVSTNTQEIQAKAWGSARGIVDAQGSAHQRFTSLDSVGGYFGFSVDLSGNTGSTWNNIFEVKTKHSGGNVSEPILKAFGKNIYWEGNKPSAADVGAITEAHGDGRYVKKGEAAGSAVTAGRLTSPRTIALSGDVTGSTTFDGSANRTITTVVNNDSHLHSHSTISGASSNEGGVLRLLYPKGAAYGSGASSVTGAFKITLPVGKTNTMMTLTVSVHDYSTDESFLVRVSGYNHTGVWTNTSATILGSKATRRLPVRFGFDGSKCCILIGDTNSRWSYPKIAVIEGIFGHSSASESIWDDGWSVGVVTSYPTIEKTHTATLPYSETAIKLNTARAIRLQGDVTGTAQFDGTSDAVITATVANDSHSHSNYALKTDKAPDSNKLDGIDSTRVVYGSNEFANNKLGDANSNRKSQFIEMQAGTNQPGTNSSWCWGWQSSHTSNGASNKYGAQMLVSQDGNAYFRVQNSTGTGTWRKVVREDIANNAYLGKTATATNSAKLDGRTKAQIITDARNSVSSLRATSVVLTAHGSDKASIDSTVSGSSTFMDFNLSDDVNMTDMYRFRFTPSGGSEYSLMELGIQNSTSVNKARVDVNGYLNALELRENGTTLSTKYAERNGSSAQDFKVKKLVVEDTVEIRKNTDGSVGFYL